MCTEARAHTDAFALKTIITGSTPHTPPHSAFLKAVRWLLCAAGTRRRLAVTGGGEDMLGTWRPLLDPPPGAHTGRCTRHSLNGRETGNTSNARPQQADPLASHESTQQTARTSDPQPGADGHQTWYQTEAAKQTQHILGLCSEAVQNQVKRNMLLRDGRERLPRSQGGAASRGGGGGWHHLLLQLEEVVTWVFPLE